MSSSSGEGSRGLFDTMDYSLRGKTACVREKHPTKSVREVEQAVIDSAGNVEQAIFALATPGDKINNKAIHAQLSRIRAELATKALDVPVNEIYTALEENQFDEKKAVAKLLGSFRPSSTNIPVAVLRDEFTFGVESEFVLPYHRKHNHYYKSQASLVHRTTEGVEFDPSEPEYQRRLFNHRMMAALKARRIQVHENPHRWFQHEESRVWRSCLPPGKEYAAWTLMDETLSTRTLPKSEDIGYSCHEIASRKLDVGDESYEEIRTVFTCVSSPDPENEREEWPQPKVAEGMGLHIHVGHSRITKNFSALQNLLLIITAFELEIEQMHPEHRKNYNFADAPRTAHSHLFSRYPNQILQELSAADSKRELIYLFAPGRPGALRRYKAYNLENLYTGDLDNTYADSDEEAGLDEETVEFRRRRKDTKETIEFRQHEGTLDSDQILAWSKFLLSLVQYAWDSEFGRINRLIYRHMLLPERFRGGSTHRGLALTQLFNEIGLDAKSKAYFKERLRALGTETPEDFVPPPDPQAGFANATRRKLQQSI